MKCLSCGNDDWEVYETDGDGMSNDYIEYIVCNNCGAEYSVEYDCKILESVRTN